MAAVTAEQLTVMQNMDLLPEVLKYVTAAAQPATAKHILTPLCFAREPSLVIMQAAGMTEAAPFADFTTLWRETERHPLVKIIFRDDQAYMRQIQELYLGGPYRLNIFQSGDNSVALYRVPGNEPIGQYYAIFESRRPYRALGFEANVRIESDEYHVPTITEIRPTRQLNPVDVNRIKLDILARSRLTLDLGLNENGSSAQLFREAIDYQYELANRPRGVQLRLTVRASDNPLQDSLPRLAVQYSGGTDIDMVSLVAPGEQITLGFNYWELQTGSDITFGVLSFDLFDNIGSIIPMSTSQWINLAHRSTVAYTRTQPKPVPDELRRQGRRILSEQERRQNVLAHVLKDEGEFDRILILTDKRDLSTIVLQALHQINSIGNFTLEQLAQNLAAGGLQRHVVIFGIRDVPITSVDSVYRVQVQGTYPRIYAIENTFEYLESTGPLFARLTQEGEPKGIGVLFPLIMRMQYAEAQTIQEKARILALSN